jgi:protein-S-isoprenylcysteine O-methyltransferase Ste14
MWRSGSLRLGQLKRKGDWTLYPLLVAWVLAITGPLVEFLHFHTRPGLVSWILGIILFAAAALVRGKAHLDLKEGFSPVIERKADQRLVTTGLYRHIRHPLYLGTLFLLIACPVFLASRISWVFALAGLVGILIRIKMEERFLIEKLEGYCDYLNRTSALIPGIF